jgi:hypothetical protein
MVSDMAHFIYIIRVSRSWGRTAPFAECKLRRHFQTSSEYLLRKSGRFKTMDSKSEKNFAQYDQSPNLDAGECIDNPSPAQQ